MECFPEVLWKTWVLVEFMEHFFSTPPLVIVVPWGVNKKNMQLIQPCYKLGALNVHAHLAKGRLLLVGKVVIHI